MKKEKYIFNTRTLQYEKHETTTRQKLTKGFVYFSSVLVTAGICFIFAYLYLPSPKEKALLREIDQLQYHYTNLTGEFNKLGENLDKLQEKDADLHRIIFGLDPIDENIWNGGVGGHEPNLYVTNFARTGDLLNAALDKVEKIKRKIDIQNASFDTLSSLAAKREDKLASIPSIKPVREDLLKRNIQYLSGFGWRIHPIYKVKKFHAGIDFTAASGTAIQATGNGKVVKVEKKNRGYGYSIVIDHGFGYQTLYGHMSQIIVKEGQKVTKGQQIGTVGSTGTSTAPHLHYEVKINGKPVNPIDFCLDGLTPSEYQMLAHRSSEENQSFD